MLNNGNYGNDENHGNLVRRQRTTPNLKARKAISVFWPQIRLYARAFSPAVRALSLKNSHRAGLYYKKWACTTGWRLALYLCSPSPALRLRVVAYLVIWGANHGVPKETGLEKPECVHCMYHSPRNFDKLIPCRFFFVICFVIFTGIRCGHRFFL